MGPVNSDVHWRSTEAADVSKQATAVRRKNREKKIRTRRTRRKEEQNHLWLNGARLGGRKKKKKKGFSSTWTGIFSTSPLAANKLMVHWGNRGGGPVQERKQKRLTQPDQHPLPPPTPPHPTPPPTEQELEVYWREKTIDHRAKASQHPATLSLSAKLFEASGTQSTGTEKGGDSPPPTPFVPWIFVDCVVFLLFFWGGGGGPRGPWTPTAAAHGGHGVENFGKTNRAGTVVATNRRRRNCPAAAAAAAAATTKNGTVAWFMVRCRVGPETVAGTISGNVSFLVSSGG